MMEVMISTLNFIFAYVAHTRAKWEYTFLTGKNKFYDKFVKIKT